MLPAIEPFTGGAGALSGSWTQVLTATVNRDGSGFGVTSTAGEDALAYWNLDGFDDNQYAQVEVFGVVNDTDTKGAAVRVDSGPNFYSFTTSNGLWKNVAGAWTSLAADPTTWANGDVLKITVEVTDIKMWKNGAQVGATVQDASIASGAGGCGGYGVDQGTTMDNFRAGNLSEDAFESIYRSNRSSVPPNVRLA